MELRHLRYFVTVAEELHFGRAAQRLHMAQPPLSQQIRQLENEMGVLLFERTNRRVELTEAGRVFFEEARAILAQVEQAVVHARRTALGERGWFGVGFVGSATYDVLPGILRQFRERYPDVELVLLELTGAEQLQALEDNRIHVGFPRVPYVAEGITQEELLRQPLMLALSTTHPLAAKTSVRLRDLAEEPFVLFRTSAQSSYGDFLIRVCQEAGFTPHEKQQVGEMQTALSLVSAGIGITLVPSSVQNFQREGVVYIPLAAPTPTIALTLSYRENDSSPILRHFLQIVRTSIE